MKILHNIVGAALLLLAFTMSGIYLIGEYTEGGFIKEFWYLYIPLIVLGFGYVVTHPSEHGRPWPRKR